MSNKKYWQSFGELNNTSAYQERTFTKEFKDDMLVSELKEETLEKTGTSRRDFLKYLGFATATVAIASSCETAVKKTIPFLNKPQNIIPGEASYYATTFQVDGEVLPVLAKVRDGRPIKIEGNELSKLYQGATSAQAQASVLGLYDTSRLRNSFSKGNQVFEKIENLDQIDQKLIEQLNQYKGKIAFVTNSIHSPSSNQLLSEFAKNYNAEIISYDDISYSGILEANENNYGKKAIPSYRFDNAELIVSIGADFLGTWVNPTAFSKQWSKKRKINSKNFKISKHYQIESLLTLTGANADERVLVKPSEEALVVNYLYHKITNQNIDISLSAEVKKSLDKIAQQLIQNKQKSLVVAGSNNKNIQIVVNAINESLQSIGNTIDWSTPSYTRQGIDKDFSQFINQLQNQKYSAVIFSGGANPVYSSQYAEILKSEIAKLPLSISFNHHLDETTQLCKYVFPTNHFLESWGDAQIKTGTYSFIQPTINPLFNTRAWQSSLLKWTGNSNGYETYLKDFWVKKLGSVAQYEKVLQDGIYESTEKVSVKFLSTNVQSALESLQQTKASNGTEVVFYQKITIGSGVNANNPWLQETPDPITKATWDNYAVISLAMAKKLNIIVDDNYEVEVTKPLVKIQIEGKEIELPILVIPGVHPDVIGIALGYGRTDKLGKTVQGVGKNIYPFVKNNGLNVQYFNSVNSISNTNNTYPLAYTQTHNSYEGRHEVMKEFTIEEFIQNPNVIIEEREEEFKKYKNGVEKEKDFVKDGTLYPHHENPGIKWGMSIDLNTCTGCSACVVACNAENNISVVGKKQVLKAHEMHWMRIDRYFSGNPENPEVVFQPMLCQHCDNAPCENVCPVAATNHSSEGLNQMTYNRCIGTRYCANNCPFKVRRFNWLDYNGADSFKDNQKPLIEEGVMDEVVETMNEDLTRLVLNPDVTVRSRGVIEKCSFCVQRLQAAKIKAKKESRPVKDGEAVTACMQACPTNAIVFGNVNDKQSEIYKLRNEDQKQRVFYSLEQIHVLPNVNYLAKLRNKEAQHQMADIHSKH